MANGASFEINVEAKSLGIDSSAAQLTAFAQKLQNVDTVATQFDSVVAAASKRLEEASEAAKSASGELAKAETKYAGLEVAANRAAKAVEKAAAAGKDTAALKVAAEDAAAAMRAQVSVVDELAAKSREAASAQSELAGTLKTLQSNQAAASAEIKKAVVAELCAEGAAFKGKEKDVKIALEDLKYEHMRRMITHDGQRIGGRSKVVRAQGGAICAHDQHRLRGVNGGVRRGRVQHPLAEVAIELVGAADPGGAL